MWFLSIFVDIGSRSQDFDGTDFTIVDLIFFSKTEFIFVLGDKLLPGTKPGFLKFEKMLRFILLYTHKVYQKVGSSTVTNVVG